MRIAEYDSPVVQSPNAITVNELIKLPLITSNTHTTWLTQALKESSVEDLSSLHNKYTFTILETNHILSNSQPRPDIGVDFTFMSQQEQKQEQEH